MPARKIKFVDGEYYHVYNRGADKRDIVSDDEDVNRFMQSVAEFNDLEPVGSIYENSYSKKSLILLGSQAPKPLVSIVCFCLNPNHFHFILRQESERGIEKFMQRLGGYPKYFNNKHKRSGVLFQGKFKANHISNDKYLLYLSAYVNLNGKIHQLESPLVQADQAPRLGKSSWGEYVGQIPTNFCRKDIILGQFSDKNAYKKYALDLLPIMIETKREHQELEDSN